MLPIFRIISVGGVTLAISILALALMPPGGTRLVLAQHEVVARGPLMDQSGHPEWRQFLIHAALRRAGEIERLRDLRDTIVRVPEVVPPEPAIEIVIETHPIPTLPLIAGLPSDGAHGEDEVTGSIGANPGATIPIEIGEASSTELPVTAAEDTPPVRLPALQMPSLESPPLPPARPQVNSALTRKAETKHRTAQQRPRRKPPATPTTEPQPLPPPFNILAAIFGSFANAQSTGPASSASRGAASSPVNRQASAATAAAQ
ncbi:MAG TPA: hypothetical protein VNR39_07795 [Pseudolabrys sp.]|nr:hypothetical protein [Pseudolabrys sp.]